MRELEAMGLTIEDLLAAAGQPGGPRPVGPTVRDYVPVVAEGYQPRSRRTYNCYWRLTVELLGDIALDRVTVDDLRAVADEAARRAGQTLGALCNILECGPGDLIEPFLVERKRRRAAATEGSATGVRPSVPSLVGMPKAGGCASHAQACLSIWCAAAAASRPTGRPASCARAACSTTTSMRSRPAPPHTPSPRCSKRCVPGP